MFAILSMNVSVRYFYSTIEHRMQPHAPVQPGAIIVSSFQAHFLFVVQMDVRIHNQIIFLSPKIFRSKTAYRTTKDQQNKQPTMTITETMFQEEDNVLNVDEEQVFFFTCGLPCSIQGKQ
jgi:hypothetical protein